MTHAADRAIDLVLYDLAGTLFRDDDRTFAVYRAVLEADRLPVDRDWLVARMGMAKRRVFAEAIRAAGRDDLDPAALDGRFTDAMLEDLRRRPPEPLPGAAESLAAIAAAGARAGWITGYARRIGESIVAQLGWRFALGVGTDEVAAGRPAPDLVHEAMRRAGVTDARRVAVVGDTPNDLHCGRAAGCGLVVGVGHGTHALEALRDHPHDLLLPSLADWRVAESLRGAAAPGSAE